MDAHFLTYTTVYHNYYVFIKVFINNILTITYEQELGRDKRDDPDPAAAHTSPLGGRENGTGCGRRWGGAAEWSGEEADVAEREMGSHHGRSRSGGRLLYKVSTLLHISYFHVRYSD